MYFFDSLIRRDRLFKPPFAVVEEVSPQLVVNKQIHARFAQDPSLGFGVVVPGVSAQKDLHLLQNMNMYLYQVEMAI